MKDLPVRKSIRLPNDAYHQNYAFSITFTTHQRYPWFRLYPEFTSMATQLLPEMARGRQTILFALCIMPDHLHLLLEDKDVVDFVRLFKGRFAPGARRLERGRGLWRRSFYDHALRKDESLADAALYIWMNPVRAGIAVTASAYPWSGSLVWPNWGDLPATLGGRG